MPTPRYDILAVDLDGTLLDPSGRVSPENAAAIDAARRAGIEVVICTGRGLLESRRPLEAIRGLTPPPGRNEAPAVVAGGAMVADAATGRTMQRWPMDLDLVRRITARFAEAERASLVLKDPHAAGYDYLVVDSGELDPANLWWFEHMGIERRHVPHIDHDEHPEHTVRVGFAAATDRMLHLGQEIMSEFKGQATLHHFAAVSAKLSSAGAQDATVHILEAFDPTVNKWTGVSWLAERRAVDPARIAAIGDEVNDVALLTGAALGIAMGNAVPAAREAADRVAPSNAEHGVARAIERILDGAW